MCYVNTLQSLPETIPENISTANSGIITVSSCTKSGKKGNNHDRSVKINKSIIDLSTTDEDDEEDEGEEEEEDLGQRPQEAGGEAMISEETSASSSNEDDESSVSSGDIP